MAVFWIACASVLLSVSAQFSLKIGMSGAAVQSALAAPFGFNTLKIVLSQTGVIGGLVLYGLSALIWLAVLARWDVSKAYPMVGMGFMLTAVVGFFFGEAVSAARLLGAALICAGVVVVART